MRDKLKKVMAHLGDRADAAMDRIDSLGRLAEQSADTVARRVDEKAAVFEERMIQESEAFDEPRQEVVPCPAEEPRDPRPKS